MVCRQHARIRNAERLELRDPERTRERLLQAAFREIYRSGFQSASLDAILASAGVTKGALYYYFKSKQGLGYAVVEEVIAPDSYGQWVRPLQSGKDPIDALIGAVRDIPVRPADVRGGCQLINLAQEMSPLDAGFRKRLAIIFDAWREAVASVLREGQTRGSVRRDVEPADAAGLLIAMVEGYGVAGKECSGSESDESGDQKYRGLAAVLAPAGQPQAGLIASVLMDSLTLLHTNRFVGSASSHRLQATEARADEEPRRKTIRSVPLNNNCGEIQLTQEEVMNRKRFQAIASLSFALIFILGAGWQARAQDAEGPYPTMAPARSIPDEPRCGDCDVPQRRPETRFRAGPRCWFLDGMAMKPPWRGRTVSCAWWDDRGIYRKTTGLFGIQRYTVQSASALRVRGLFFQSTSRRPNWRLPDVRALR